MSSAVPGQAQRMTDPVLERALRAVGRTRAHGLHFFGHFVGIVGRLPSPGHAVLEIEAEPSYLGPSSVSLIGLSSLVDLALGSAIRSQVAAGARLGTVTLSVQHPASGPGPLVADASVVHLERDQGTARCAVLRQGQVVGHAQGWFSALPPPVGRSLALLPWERDPLPPVVVPRLEALDDHEAGAVAAAVAAGERAASQGTAASQELLALDWRPSVQGRASGTLRIGPELANRVGHVQGGALYGAAALAATRALDLAEATLVDGHYQFLRPADGAVLVLDAVVLRRGRRAAFVEVRLEVQDKLVGTGLFGFQL